MTEDIEKAILRLKEIDPKVKVRKDKKNQRVLRIRGRLSEPQVKEPRKIAREFLASHADIFSIRYPEEELLLRAEDVDRVGNTHIRYQQMHEGLPVFGRELIVHMDSARVVRGINGKYVQGIKLQVKPKIQQEKVVDLVLDDDEGNNERKGEEPMLLVLVHNDEPFLSWHLTVDGKDKDLHGGEMPAKWEYFVNAMDGKIIWKYNNIQTHDKTTGTGTGRYSGDVILNTVHNHDTQSWQLEDRWTPGCSGARIYTYDCAGALPCSLSEDTGNDWSANEQRDAVDCHHFTRIVFDYFFIMHGRNSYDDAGADLNIYARYPVQNNGYWDGTRVAIGQGDGVDFEAICTLDFIAHEWTHAVTEHSAGLIYSDESGALNEAMSDIFAALIDGDWLWFEDGWLKATAPAGRNLADPTNGGQYDPADSLNSVLDGHQPDHTDDMYTGTNNSLYVHCNSGIMNKAAYLIAVGGTHRDIKICDGLGREVLGRLYYQALTQHLTASSDFEDMLDAVLDSLEDLYLGDLRYDKWRRSIINAFAAVGVGDSVGCITCWIAPIICPPSPDIIQCPPFPSIPCPVAPIRIICPPSPDIILCPPSPDRFPCPPQPRFICPPLPDRFDCPPMPRGCLPGPDPLPFNPERKKRHMSKRTEEKS